jgi:hypothetical protein
MISSDRLHFIDNIRWFIIILVVVLHAGVTYSNIGHWYYREPADLGVVTYVLFLMFLTFTQAYSMGLLFLIAGYFVPGSFDRKGFARFLRDRMVRLGIPTLIYMLFIQTAIIYYLLAFQWKGLRPPFSEYLVNYIKNFDFLGGSGPMWFALALLIFSAIYAAFRRFSRSSTGPKPEKEIPGHFAVVGLVLLISAGAFAIRLFQPIGTSVMNMQLCYFSSYIIMFIIGIISYRNRWLQRISYSFAIVWFKAAIICGSIFWLALMVHAVMFSEDPSMFSGGLNWQSVAYAFWESFFCVGTCLGLIAIFRDHFAWKGRLARFLSDNGFSVYLFHPPILILLTLALKDMAWHPMVKFAVSSALAVPICFLASHFIFRRIPLLKRIL